MMAYRIAYYKVYYPLAFYSSYFSVRAQDFDEVIMIGYEEVRRRLEEIEEEVGNRNSVKEILSNIINSNNIKAEKDELNKSEEFKCRSVHDGKITVQLMMSY